MSSRRADDPATPVSARNAGLEELYRLYRWRIHAICLAYLREPTAADDALQEVFVRAGRQLATRREGPIQAYLDSIARNVCREELRRSRRAALKERSAPADALEPEELVMNRRLVDDLWGQLSVRDRLLIIHRFAGYSQAEMAARLHMSIKAVEMGLLRARRRARRILEGLPAVLAPWRRWGAQSHARRGGWAHLGLSSGAGWLALCSLVPATLLVAAVLPWSGRAPALMGAPLRPGGRSVADMAAGADPFGVPALGSVAPAPADERGGGALYVPAYPPGCSWDACSQLYRSTDGGGSWTRLRARGFAGGTVLAGPAGSRAAAMLLASGPQGLERSDDGGASFRIVVPVLGPVALLAGSAPHHAVAVIAARSLGHLELYDVTTGATTQGAALPPGDSPDDVTPMPDGEVVVSVQAPRSAVSPGTTSQLLRCALSGSCRVVLTDTHTAALRLPLQPADGTVTAVSDHEIYASSDGSPFAAIHDFGRDTLVAVDVVSGSGTRTVLAALWSAAHGTGLFEVSTDGGRDMVVRAAQPWFSTARGIATARAGRIVVSADDGRVLVSSDGGARWRSVAVSA